MTYIGGPTALIEVAGLRLLTDPTFDPPGKRFRLTQKLQGPAIGAPATGHIDAVLLSHDQHPDNLDDAGRAALQGAALVLTTPAGAQRLGGKAIGLRPWQTHVLQTRSGRAVRVTAVPARHGPEGFEGRTGDVTGFVVASGTEGEPVLYISGDTVFFEGVAEVGRRFRVGTA
ncbi:MAG TPA: MBL fold metallo-hydrolase, partial [Aggregicoccus sp.]|nr:MBL fold metallo-hydrolase [Aggregicoccus sp.]